jgi:hypothetical protein
VPPMWESIHSGAPCTRDSSVGRPKGPHVGHWSQLSRMRHLLQRGVQEKRNPMSEHPGTEGRRDTVASVPENVQDHKGDLPMSTGVSEKEQESWCDKVRGQRNSAEHPACDNRKPEHRGRKGYDRAFFAAVGKRGGKIGGKVRAQRMTAQQRSDSARKAAMIRWRRFRAGQHLNSSL